MNKPQTWTLSNGIRVIYTLVNSPVAHCGLFINAGSRDELNHEHGLAHFIEHSVFKGTPKRKAYHILSRMEDVGGEINAYTSKEETVLYGTFLSAHYQRAIDLLNDIAFHSSFPEKEINKEKTVIIDEINSYKDSPSEEIYDRFEEQIYPNHSLGHDILGTPAHLKKFSPADIKSFISRTWNTDQIVFSFVGNIPVSRVKAQIDRTIGLQPANLRNFNRQPVPVYAPTHQIEKRKNHQAHLVMGNLAYSVKDPKRTGLILLNNLLGGPGMSSRLNLAIREKYGWTYNIDSGYAIFSDTGLWSVYLGTEAAWVDRCRELVLIEMKKLREKELGVLQLQKAKNQLIGQMAIAQESNSSLMLGFAKTFLIFNKIDTFEEVVQKIESLSSKDLRDIANEVFNESQLSSLLYQGR
ncbi:MAG TPA: pitrilysin family protein [Flavobacteriales bacterium]|nr:pitrilysin family protein [Flavobacteriales bacterium]HPH81254.1 pitrilysin family protein [Flavobacteriales bacterium]